MSPDSPSTVARVVDSLSSAEFVCNITCDGGLQVITWTLSNFNGTDGETLLRSGVYSFLSIDGDIRPGLGTYRNRLTIRTFPEALDGSVLKCTNSGNTYGRYNLRIYRES